MKTMSHYEFWRLFCLENIDPNCFCGRDHLVSAVQRQGIRKKYGSTTTTTVSAHRDLEKKRQHPKRKLDMEMFAVTRKNAPKKDVVTKAPRVNDDAL